MTNLRTEGYAGTQMAKWNKECSRQNNPTYSRIRIVMEEKAKMVNKIHIIQSLESQDKCLDFI